MNKTGSEPKRGDTPPMSKEITGSGSESRPEYELRARHPEGVIARLSPYTRYYWSTEPGDGQPPFPVTLFVVDIEEVEATYVRTAARMSRMSLPILVSCIPVLSTKGILGKSWRPLWEVESSRLALSELRAYQWDSLYHRMRHVLVCWFWVVIMTSLRGIRVRHTVTSWVMEDRT